MLNRSFARQAGPLFIAFCVFGLSQCAVKRSENNRSPGQGGSGDSVEPGTQEPITNDQEPNVPVAWTPSIEIHAELVAGEQLYLAPSYAVLDQTGMHGSLHLTAYKDALSAFQKNLLLSTLNILGQLPNNPDQNKNFQIRIADFLVKYLDQRVVRIKLRGEEIANYSTGKDGDVYFTYNDPAGAQATDQLAAEGSFTVTPIVHTNSGEYRALTAAAIEVVRPKGLSIISDIDDTIKVSNVGNTAALLKSTFLDDFVAVTGMSELYQNFKTNCAATIHYVSGSPEQLGPTIWSFLSEKIFPLGSLHLKRARFVDSSYLNMVGDQVTYKKDIITKIINQFPQRQFIFIGDTGEKDPEVYSSYLATHAAQIKKIYLRKVNPSAALDTRLDNLFNKSEKLITFTHANSIAKNCGD